MWTRHGARAKPFCDFCVGGDVAQRSAKPKEYNVSRPFVQHLCPCRIHREVYFLHPDASAYFASSHSRIAVASCALP